MKNLLVFISLGFVLSGCLKGKNEIICSYDPCQFVAPATEIQSVQSYLTANNITATQHCSGMFYAIETQGGGINPSACGGASVKYKGMLTDGTVFDQSPPNQAVVFTMGNLIPGFKNGLLQLKVGGKMKIYIPPYLGYGNVQQGTIPANSILIFEVELINAQ